MGCRLGVSGGDVIDFLLIIFLAGMVDGESGFYAGLRTKAPLIVSPLLFLWVELESVHGISDETKGKSFHLKCHKTLNLRITHINSLSPTFILPNNPLSFPSKTDCQQNPLNCFSLKCGKKVIPWNEDFIDARYIPLLNDSEGIEPILNK